MRTFRLNKLVRDKILLDMQALGQQVTVRKLNDEEFVAKLADKLVEEAKEFDPSEPKASDELADILEVIKALAKEMGINFDELRELQAKRREKRGGFQERFFVERLGVPDNDKWAEYYAREP